MRESVLYGEDERREFEEAGVNIRKKRQDDYETIHCRCFYR